MIGLQIGMVVVSLLLLGAHFLRAGALLLVVACLGLIGLLFVRRPWAARVIQTGLLLGALVWILTLVEFASARMRRGEPVVRLIVILGAVTAWTLVAALAMGRGRLTRRFRPDGPDTPAPPSS